jgi:predicted GNAT family N-acyltransferase
MHAIAIREIRSPAEIEQALAIRRTVFIEEQGVSEALEFDGLDQEARHLLASVDGEPSGTLRIRLVERGRVAKIERVAVLAHCRHLGIGRMLMARALEIARSQAVDEVRLHAQTVVKQFYARLGFVATGAEFEEDGIAHIAMLLSLTTSGTASALSGTGRP